MANFSFLFKLIGRRKRLIAVICLIVMMAAIFYLRQNNYLTYGNTLFTLEQHPFLAPFLFIVIYGLMVAFFIPTLPMNLGAGFLWGTFWGGPIAILGASLGAVLSFIASRYLARDYFNNKFNNKIWLWLKQELQKKNWKIVAFTRANPAFPFGLTSYFFGLTDLSFGKYFWPTIIAISPVAFLIAYIGDLANGIVLNGGSQNLIGNIFLLSSIITLLIVGLFVISRYWRNKNLRKSNLNE